MTNPYLRAAQALPAIREQASIKLEERLQHDAGPVDGVAVEGSPDNQEGLTGDEPIEPEAEGESDLRRAADAAKS